jgi:hypothetical protein
MNHGIKIFLETIRLLQWAWTSFCIIIVEKPSQIFSRGNRSESINWIISVLAWMMVTVLAVAFWHPFILKSHLSQLSKVVYVLCIPAFCYQGYMYYWYAKYDNAITDDVRLTATQNRLKRYFATYMPIIELIPTLILAGLTAFKGVTY